MKEENLVQKYSRTTHYTDIMIFVVWYFNLNHPEFEHFITWVPPSQHRGLLVLHCSAHEQPRRDIWPGGQFNMDPRRLWDFLERIGVV